MKFLDPAIVRRALGEVAAELLTELDQSAVKRFARYLNDPVGFAVDVMRLRPWSRQAEILMAVAEHDRVLVRSGHKIGKSLSAVILACWFVATRSLSRVMMSAPSADQVKKILWRDLTTHYPPIATLLDGPTRIPKDPATGVQLSGRREIFGRTAAKTEGLAGVSGAELLFIIDEASGFEDEHYQAIKGNTAGGAKIVAFSNPTRTAGWFYDGFRNGLWHCIHVSSEESPNVVDPEGEPIAGLAGLDFIEEMRTECGAGYAEHPIYQVRVRGNFPGAGPFSVFGLELVELGRKRWDEHVAKWPQAGLAIPELARLRGAGAKIDDGVFGELELGIDPKRYGDDDATIFARRGKFCYRPITLAGRVGAPEIAEAAVQVVRALRRPIVDQRPIPVKIDSRGPAGDTVGALRHHPAAIKGELVVVDVDVSAEAPDSERYKNLRSQHWFGGAKYLAEGGMLPGGEPKLTQELLLAQFGFDERNRFRVQSKDEMRKTLKRSPNHADGYLLACWGVPIDPLKVQSKLPSDRTPEESPW